MRKIIAAVLLLMLASTPVLAGKPCPDEEQMLKEKRLDLDTKTLKGWVRLLKNKSKQNDYGVVLTKEEVVLLIKCLNEEIEYRKKAGKLS